VLLRAITRRALIAHYLRKHKKGLDYGSDWPRDLDEADYHKRMVRLKRSQKNSYDKRHGRTGSVAADQAPPGRRLFQTVPMSCTMPGVYEVTQKTVSGVSSQSIPSLMSLDFTDRQVSLSR